MRTSPTVEGDPRVRRSAGTGVAKVPTTAKSRLINLSVIPISGVGAPSDYATGATQPCTYTINWSSGVQVLANAATAACDPSQRVDVAIVESSGASTDYRIDVVGSEVETGRAPSRWRQRTPSPPSTIGRVGNRRDGP